MQKKTDQHVFQGMQRDMSISKQKAEFLWDAHNIRLTSRHGDTLLSMTNEKGTKRINNVSFTGIVLGYCVLGDYLTVFVINPGNTEKPDYIYRVQKSGDSFMQTTLYNGNLGFDAEHPIECLGVYENVDIQKVYWTDGINQPRFINITDKPSRERYIDTSFDFVSTLELKDSISVQKVPDSSGLFPAGVIQYAVTYYNKYGQESNISTVSPLIPTSYTSRAGSPEDTIGNAFKVSVRNPDMNFEYLRLYSIFRSSKDTTPVCKRVADVKLEYEKSLSNELFVSDDETSVKSGRIVVSTAYFKVGYDGVYTKLIDDTTYKGTEYITIGSTVFEKGKYYHFNKISCPQLIIRAQYLDTETQKFKTKFYTWGTCADIYISTAETTNPGAPGQLILADGDTPYMTIASDIHYMMDETSASNTVVITDNNTVGENIDANELLFVGGEDITAGTLTQKDGTMFLGDINIRRPQIKGSYDNDNANTENIIKLIRDSVKNNNVNCSHRVCWFPKTMSSSTYKWGNTLDAHVYNGEELAESTNIAGFKHGEHYRLGLQFQYKTGKWSQPVFINDYTETVKPSLDTTSYTNCRQNIPTFKITLPTDISVKVASMGYKRVRGVVCFPTESDQLILCQGMLNPTVHSIAGRVNHTPDVQSSWFFRPMPAGDESEKQGYWDCGRVQYKHDWTLYSGEVTQPYTNDTLSKQMLAPTRHDEIQGTPVQYSNIPITEYFKDSESYEFKGEKPYIDVTNDAT